MNKVLEGVQAGGEAFHKGTANPFPPDLVRSWREDGAVLIKNALDAREMSLVREVFEYQLANIPPWAFDERTDNTRFVIDPINPAVWESPIYQRLWNETKLPEMAAGAFTTPDVWLWYSQIFFKQSAAEKTVRRTEWHQDLMLDPLEGGDLLRFWIPLESLEEGYSLDFVRGSHRGPIYNSGSHSEEAALTANNGKPMAPLPDIEADRSQWDITTWAVEPGDILAFHPGVIHSGGASKPNGARRTLTMLLFGRDVRYGTRPPAPASLSNSMAEEPDRIIRERLANVKPGEPVCLSTAPRIR